MRESQLWHWFEENRPSWLEAERFETSLPAGTADCFLTDTRTTIAVCGWLELKYCAYSNEEYKAGRIPKLRPTQPMFLRRMAARGVPSGILLRAGTTFYLFRATRDHAWSNTIRGNYAIRSADRTWKEFPTVADVWGELVGVKL